MKPTIIFSLILITIAVVNAKKWSDKDIHEQQQGHNHNHKLRKHEYAPEHDVNREERRREKELYYRNKQFSGVDHKLIQKHSPIAVSEDDAKLQADLDEGDVKHERKKVHDELHRQHLIGADEGKINRKWNEKKHEAKIHHSKEVTNTKDKPISIPEVVEEYEHRNGHGKHGRKEKKERRQKENKRQQEKQKKHKKRYGYKKAANGKRYKLTVYEKN